MPGRIFISYSKADPEPTRALADFLTAQGYTVWWDTNLTSGEVFREVIDRELAAADAVIVIWTAHSVASNWVVSEADDAARRNKLITVRTGDLEPWRIPKPYNTYHTDLVDNRNAVLAAVRRVAGEPPKPEINHAPSLSEATLHEALALEHWQAIKTSADPAKLRTFLKEFGNTKCAPLARSEFERLAKRDWQELKQSNNKSKLDEFAKKFAGTPLSEAAAEMAMGTPVMVTLGYHGKEQLDSWPIGAAILWVLVVVPLAIYIGPLFEKNKWSYIDILPTGNWFASGAIIGLILVLTTAAVLVLRRGIRLSLLEAMIYWLGTAICIWLFSWMLSSVGHDRTFDGSTAVDYGIATLVFICYSAFAFAWWWKHQRKTSQR